MSYSVEEVELIEKLNWMAAEAGLAVERYKRTASFEFVVYENGLHVFTSFHVYDIVSFIKGYRARCESLNSRPT